MRPNCECGNLCKPNGHRTNGDRRYYAKCSSCLKLAHKQGTAGNRGGTCRTRSKALAKFKKDTCEHRGFIPVHPCQLEIDHGDGDKMNNKPSNLITLCGNCHNLKTLAPHLMWRVLFYL